MFAERRISSVTPSPVLLQPESDDSIGDSGLRFSPFSFNPVARGVRGMSATNPFGTGVSMCPADPALLAACVEGDEFRLRDLMVRRRLSHESVNMADASGKTALTHVCATGNLGLLDLLLLIPGVDPNVQDKEGNTPLHLAAQAGHPDVVNRLLSTFPEIRCDVRNHNGLTPLMKAALQGKTRCIKLLLSAGASTTIRDPGRGLNAHDWALFCGRHAAAKMIEAYNKIQRRQPTDTERRWSIIDDDEFSRYESSSHESFSPHALSMGSSAAVGGQQLVHKIRRAFKPLDPRRDDFDVARNLVLSTTSAALVPNSVPPRRPSETFGGSKLISIPRLQITLSPSIEPPPLRRFSFRECRKLDHR